MLETYEVGYPWIIYRYPRPDWIAFILGGKVICECLICGQRETVKLSKWDIWSSPRMPDYRHPFRDQFLGKHGHPDKCSKEMRIFWAKPLKNI